MTMLRRLTFHVRLYLYEMARTYRMQARAAGVEATRTALLQAALELHRERWADEITLDELAARAGTTVQTLLRHFGSRDGLLTATAEWASDRVDSERPEVEAGNAAAAARAVCTEYEAYGDDILRLLYQEERVAFLAPFVERGREFHRDWVARSLPAADRRRLAQLVAVTDVYTWKLLRRDSGLSAAQTELAIRELVQAIQERTP
jgi:AcrR family transcriptional regulator